MTLNDLEPAERKRLARSVGGGAVFWVLALILLAFVPVTRKPFPEPDYPPVHLSLTSPVTAAAPVKQTAAQQEPVSQPQNASAPASKAAPTQPAAAKAQAQPAPAPAKAKTAPATKPATPSAASGGLGIPDFDKPVTSSTSASGEAESLDFTSSRQTQNPAAASVPPGGTLRSELEGSAATVSAGKSTGASVSSKAASGSSGSASASTAEALKGVEGAASSALPSTGSPGASGSASAYAETSTNSAGRVSSVEGLRFTEGADRALIVPKEPRIILPEPLAKLIDSSRDVTVKFRVDPNGSVQRSSITFSPSAILPDKIQTYLKDQFEKWRFENGSESGQASFAYSIKLE